MEHRRLGLTEIHVSTIGLGCMTFGSGGIFATIGGTSRDEACRLIHMACDAGINFFDTAADYSLGVSESFLGAALRSCRSCAVVSTKVCSSVLRPNCALDLSAANVRASCEASLRRLRTSYIDTLYLHNHDPHVPLAESIEALERLCDQGLIRSYGFSNFSARQIHEAMPAIVNNRRFAGLQNSYCLLDWRAEQEILPHCVDHGLALVCWSALAGGALTGKYERSGRQTEKARYDSVQLPERYAGEAARQRLRLAQETSSRQGKELSTLALEYVLDRKPPVASALIGARHSGQLLSLIAHLSSDSPALFN